MCRSFLFNDGRVVGLRHALVRRQTDLAVDDEHFVVGEVDEEIRSVQLARLIPLRRLLRIVNAFYKAHLLEDALQLVFAPVALHLRFAFQGVGEVLRFRLQALVEGEQLLEFFVQLPELLSFVAVKLVHPVLQLGELFLNGLDHGGQCLFTAFTEVLLVAFGVFFDDVTSQQVKFALELCPTVFGFLCVVFIPLLCLAACLDGRLQFLPRARQFFAGPFQL